MTDYADYDVRPIDSMLDVLHYSSKTYSNKFAFISDSYKKTYRDLKADAATISVFISENSKKYVIISIKDKYLFSVAYFATVVSGKIAVLLPNEKVQINCIPNDEICMMLDDNAVSHCLKTISAKDFSYSNFDVNDVCTVLFSSGTSGEPKGVMLSQKNICTDIVAGMQKFAYLESSIYLSVLPYTHAFGLVCVMLAPIYSGGTIYTVGENPSSFFGGLEKCRPTCLNVPPAALNAILTLAKNTSKDISQITGGRLQKVLSGGAATSEHVAKEFEKHGIFVSGCYGLTECSPCVSVNREHYYKYKSAGVILNCNDVEIIDGEITVTGSNVMVGYMEHDDNSAKLIAERLYTGDCGFVDEDGFLYVTGRKNTLIIFSNGTKLLPETLERVINKHSMISESLVTYAGDDSVIISAVCGDRCDKQEIRSYIKSVCNYKIADIIIRTEPLPRTQNGKLKRN